jgi:ubiquitin-protein ligase
MQTQLQSHSHSQNKDVNNPVYYLFRTLIDEPNKNAISSINLPCIKSRLKREYSDLYTKYPNSIIYIYNNESLKKISFSIRIDEGNKMQNYVFLIDNKYPFYPPRIEYNHHPYSLFLQSPSNRFGIYLQKLFNKNCLCCASLDCKYNWSPGINLSMIINDISLMRKYKRCIVKAILIDAIKDKYLIDDIDILTYIM